MVWVACLYLLHNTYLGADSWSLVPPRVKPKNDNNLTFNNNNNLIYCTKYM